MDSLPLQFELARPAWLAVLLVLPVVLYFHAIGLVQLPRLQRRASLAVRCLILLLLALALAGLTWNHSSRRRAVVFLVDESASVGAEARTFARRFIARSLEHSGDHEVWFLPFAAGPGRLSKELPESLREREARRAAAEAAEENTTTGAEAEPDTRSAEPRNVTATGSDIEDRAYRLGSNLAAAIEVATAFLPPSSARQLVLLTDGNQTTGDALRTAVTIEVPIATVPLPERAEPEVQVSAVEVPVQVRQGEPFYVEVVVDSNHEGEGWVDLYRGAHRVNDEETSVKRRLRKGENRFRIRQTAVARRQLMYTARLRGFEDRLLDNNSASGLVLVAGRPRVLLVEREPRLARPLVSALREHDIDVDVRPPAGAPDELAELQDYEVVVLSNVPAAAFRERQMELLRTYVRDLGGGLIMLGGDQSFGLGGYYRTTLEEVLPVSSDFEKQEEKPSLAMVLLVDKSGSMGGLKMALAKDATQGAVELLGPQDQVGVIAFDGASYWVSPLRTAADKESVMRSVSRIQPSGGTNFYPALEDALRGLQDATARLKHVILLTDGRSTPGDFEGIIGRLDASRITVSTVGVGGDADRKLLETIARLGHGRYYHCDDPRSVPQIFAQETLAAGKSAINEEPFLPLLARPTSVLRDIPLDDAPFLLGFVATRPKPTSEVILATETGEPLLAWWRYGLGVAAAFTSDASPRWAAEWIAWPEFGPFWAQVIRHAMRKSETRGVEVQLRRQESELEVVLDAIEPTGRFRNAASTELTLIDPDLNVTRHVMPQTAPGRYATRVKTPVTGTYQLQLSQHRGGRLLFQQSRGYVVGYPEELRLRPRNSALLRSVARVSGGQYDPRPETLLDVERTSGVVPEPLWPYLLTAAVLLLVVDVALRRLELTRLLAPPDSLGGAP